MTRTHVPGLDDFPEWLRKRRFAPDFRIPYLVRWVRRFRRLSASPPHMTCAEQHYPIDGGGIDPLSAIKGDAEARIDFEYDVSRIKHGLTIAAALVGALPGGARLATFTPGIGAPQAMRQAPARG